MLVEGYVDETSREENECGRPIVALCLFEGGNAQLVRAPGHRCYLRPS